MSPASKSKSKDKRAGKESQQKASSKPSGNNGNAVGGIPTSGYNPLLGTFHTLETAPVSSAPPLYANGRFRNIDETDDHGGAGGVEYDSVSNNDSWSGESEDHRDKTAQLPLRHDPIPGGADNDKREKIRQKNEKKHQRQKERRAQELHERCSGYLMSRKLEALAQQLVTMGFSSERATMALILNEGKVEESVAWLFEGGEESEELKEHNNLDAGGNLKIDISEELARIAEMETKFKCSKMDIERAVVACEGDLDKAAESLRVQKQDPPSAPPKPEETGDPPTASNTSKTSIPVSQNSSSSRAQPKPSSSTTIQQRRDEKDFNYAKVAVVSAGLSSMEPGSSKNMQSLKKSQAAKSEWAKPQHVAVPTEKRWPVVAGSNHPPVNYSLASPLQPSPQPSSSKMETRYVAAGNELKNLQLGSVREPIIVMQRPQSANAKPVHPTTSLGLSPPGTTAGWQPNNCFEATKPINGLGPHIPPSTKSLGPINTSSNHQLYNQLHYQQQQQQYLLSNGSLDPAGTSSSKVNNGMWNRSGTSPPLAAASSLGLFSGLGSNGSSGSSSPVDWNAGGSMLHLDYTNIDWSLDRGPTSSSSRRGAMWQHGVNSFMQSDSQMYESYSSSGLRVKSSTMRPMLTDGGSHEWTSPFEEKDIFSLPRQFVSSPSL